MLLNQESYEEPVSSFLEDKEEEETVEKMEESSQAPEVLAAEVQTPEQDTPAPIETETQEAVEAIVVDDVEAIVVDDDEATDDVNTTVVESNTENQENTEAAPEPMDTEEQMDTEESKADEAEEKMQIPKKTEEEESKPKGKYEKRYFVGNIPKGTAAGSLKTYWEKFNGQFHMMKENSDRPYGFVSVFAESDSKAIEAEEHKVGESKLNIDPANKFELKYFVGGINKDVTKKSSFEQYFKQFGEITDCFVQNQRGFGFVTFSVYRRNSMKEFEDAQHTIDGRTVDIKPANPRPSDRDSGRGGRGGRGRGGRRPSRGSGYGGRGYDDYGPPPQRYERYGRRDDYGYAPRYDPYAPRGGQRYNPYGRRDYY